MTEYEKMTGEGSMNENKLRVCETDRKDRSQCTERTARPSAGRRRSDSAGKDGD